MTLSCRSKPILRPFGYTRIRIAGIGLFLLSILLLAACNQPVEIVTIEVTSTADDPQIVTREVVVTREVFVTPPGAGQAIPGPDLLPTRPVVTSTQLVTPTLAPSVPPVGSVDRPVQFWFPPHIPAGVLAERGPILQAWLEEQTGREFTIEHAQTVAELVAVLCSASGEAVGILPAPAYLLAHEQCDSQAGGVALKDGLAYQMGMILARTGSGLQSLTDLNGLTWAVPETGSLTRDLAVQAMLSSAGVETGDMVQYSGDNDAMLALIDGEVDFATTTYIPPILPFAEREWVYGVDDPAEWQFLGVAPERHPQGYIVVIADPELGGYRIRDARAGIFDVAPTVFSQTRIVDITAPLPNETLVFGPDFPVAAANAIRNALMIYTGRDECGQSLCAADFYGWQGLQPVAEDTFDPLMQLIAELNLTEDDIWDLVEP